MLRDAQTRLLQASRETARRRMLPQRQSIARETLELAVRAALEKTVIRAQVAGTVLPRNARPGDVVQPGDIVLADAGADLVDGQSVRIDNQDAPISGVGDASGNAFPVRFN